MLLALAGIQFPLLAQKPVTQQVTPFSIQPGGAVPSVTPQGTSVTGSVGANSYSFSVRNSGTKSGVIYVSASCTGSGLSACSASPGSFSLAAGATRSVTVSYTGSAGASGQVGLNASNDDGSSSSYGWINVTVPAPTPTYNVAVTPDGASYAMEPGSTSYSFTVQNTGNNTATYVLTPTCAGVATGCSAPASVTVAGNGGTATVVVSFSASTRGGTGTVSLGASYGGYSDNGSVNVSVNNSYGVSVTPDGGSQQITPGTTSTNVDFVVTNTGSSTVTYSFSTQCGQLENGGCSVYPASYTLGAGASVGVGVTADVTQLGSAFQVALNANDFTHGSADAGTVNVSTATYTVTVNPKGTEVWVEPSAQTATSLYVYNGGTAATTTYQLSASCGTSEIGGTGVTGCSSQPTVTVNRNEGQNVPVSFTSGQPGDSGTVYLTASAPGTSNQGWVTVRTYNRAVTVTPTVQTVNVEPGTYTQSFTIRNIGNVGATYTLTPACSGVATACAPSTGSILLNPGAQGSFSVSYSAQTRGQSGQVSLTAAVGSFSSTGSLAVNVNNSYSVSVTPDAGSAAPLDGGSAGTATFVVHNTGTGGTSYNLTSNCTGLALPCSPTLVKLSLAGGDSGSVGVSYTNGAPGTTGSITLTAQDASRPTVQDAGWVSTSVTSYAVDVSSSSGSVNSEPGVPASQIFTVRNNGNATANYTLTATCSRAATGCPAVRTLSVPAGSSGADTVRYTVGLLAGDTGSVRLKATGGTFSSVTVDSEVVKLTVNSHTMAVAPKGGSVTVYAGTHTQSFSVKNSGNVTSDFEVGARCSVSVAVCSVSPELITNLGVNASQSVTVSYATNDAGGSGGLTLIANSVLNPAVRDSGTLSMTVKPTYNVTVTPVSGTVYEEGDTATVNFTATNTGSANATYTLAPTCTGSGAPNGCTTASPTVSIARGATATIPVIVPMGVPGSVSTIALSVTSTSDNSFAGFASVNLVATKYEVSVVPQIASVTAAAYAAESRSFTVTNRGNTTRRFEFQAQCALPVASNCSTNIAWDSITAGASKVVNFSYTAGEPQAAGGIRLFAMDHDNRSSDDSTMTLTVGTSIANSAVVVNEVNPGTSIERSQCVIVGIVRDVADECGALRIVHPLPAVRTLGMARVPTLVYSSDQVQGPTLAVDIILADTVRTPDRVLLNVFRTWPNGFQDTVPLSLAGSDWSVNRRRRVVVPAGSAANDSTGILHYTVEVRLQNGLSFELLAPAVSGDLAVVNRTKSSFGGGWWLAGLERLYGQTDGSVFWVGGDGSTRKYLSQHSTTGNDTVYVAAALAAPDTLLHRVDGKYQRQAGNGLYVEFSNDGLHRRTVNRHGYATLFEYDSSGRLIDIKLPQRSGTTAHTYVFVNNSVGMLDSIIAPAIGGKERNVVITRNAGEGIRAITEHLGDSTYQVTFGFQAEETQRYAWRADRRSVPTFFTAEAALPTIRTFATGTGTGTDTVRHTFRSTTASAASGGSASLDSVYAWYDGPRPDSVSDTTKFWLDRFGAPIRIVNALGQETTLKHGDIRFPALVTETRLNNGFTTWAAYDERGNLAQTTQINPHDDGKDATTSYQWHPKWNMVTRVVQPEGETIEIGYADSTGDRLSQQDARGAVSRASFTYQGGFLTSVQAPGASCDVIAKRGCEFFTPDAMGNVATATDPVGGETRYERDAIGRVLVTRHQIVPGNTTLWQDDSLAYDLADRVSREVQRGPAMRAGEMASQSVVTHYRDAMGSDTLVKRWSEPDQASVGVIETRWAYDALGRPTTQTAPDGAAETIHYDLAGNVKQRINRNGKTIDYEYDALSRLRKDSFPEFTYAARYAGLGNISLVDGVLRPYPWFPTSTVDSSITIDGDVETFSYDAVGNLTRADNGSALVRRGYYANGSLRADTSIVRTFDTRDTVQHIYGTAFRYDRDGRLRVLTLPSQLSPRAAGANRDSITYGFDALGQLNAVAEPLGAAFTFTYNAKGERIRLALPGGIRDSSVYDEAGRVVRSLVYNSAQGREPYPGALLRDQTFSLDAAGRMLNWQNVSGLQNADTSWYGGLGHLVRYAYHQPVQNAFGIPGMVQDIEWFTLDAMGNRYASLDTTNLDATGRTANQMTGVTFSYADPTAKRTGRLRAIDFAAHHDSLLYDAAGNEVISYTYSATATSVQNAPRNDRVSYYGADGRLRATESRDATVIYQGDSEGWPFTVTAEDYRYDALGRRVLVRARRTCRADHLGYDNSCGAGWLRRTIWSGDQVLGEIKMPVGRKFSALLMEVDTEALRLPVFTNPTVDDPGPRYGRVVYTHAGGMDQPLAITRMGYSDNQNNAGYVDLPPFTVVPHWDPRGQADMGTMTDGGTKFCDPVQTTRCTSVYWRQRSFAFVQSGPDVNAVAWYGTLKDDGKDGSGMLYRRNRYVNPETGRFTQEDPIGLAGGINTYGFASGDPVNFGDPFGLCVPAWLCPAAFSFALEHPVAAATIVTLVDRELAGFSAAMNVQAPPRGGDTGWLLGQAALALGARTPVGSGGSLAADVGPAANGISGRRGFEVLVPRGTNAPADIDGLRFTGHALDQMQGRGITPSMVRETIKNGAKSMGYDGATIYRTDNMRVLTNPNGSVKTAMWQ